jgi:hypothetical protein
MRTHRDALEDKLRRAVRPDPLAGMTRKARRRAVALERKVVIVAADKDGKPMLVRKADLVAQVAIAVKSGRVKRKRALVAAHRAQQA